MKFGGYFPGLNNRELKSLQVNCFGDDGDDEGGGDDRGFFEEGPLRGGRGSNVATREKSRAEDVFGGAIASAVGAFSPFPGASTALRNFVGQNDTFNVDPATGQRIGGGRTAGVSDVGDKDFQQAALSGIQTFGGGGVANGQFGGGAIGGAVSEELTGLRESIEEQRRQFDIGQANLAPFREAGTSALQQQQALLGLLGPEAEQQALDAQQESPTQAFIRKRQERTLARNTSATGGLGGGNFQSDLSQLSAGFAGQQLNQRQAQLAALSGTGQSTAVTQAGLGAQFAGNVGQLQQGAAQSRASGLLAQQALQQQQRTADSAASAAQTQQLLGFAGQFAKPAFDFLGGLF